MEHNDYLRLATEMARMAREISYTNLDWISSVVMDDGSESDIMQKMYEKACNARIEITIDGHTFYF